MYPFKRALYILKIAKHIRKNSSWVRKKRALRQSPTEEPYVGIYSCRVYMYPCTDAQRGFGCVCNVRVCVCVRACMCVYEVRKICYVTNYRALLPPKEPLIIGLFCRKWPMTIRHPMGLGHPVVHVLRECTYICMHIYIYIYIYIYSIRPVSLSCYSIVLIRKPTRHTHHAHTYKYTRICARILG